MWANLNQKLQQLILPNHCALCRTRVSSGLICIACKASLTINSPCCARCALPLPQAQTSCGRCNRDDFYLDQITAPFRYQFPLDGLILRFKHHSELSLAKAFADLCAASYQTRIDALVPVPLHVTRLRTRGFDQALIYAKAIAEVQEKPIGDALIRTRDTGTQAGLRAVERVENVKGAFAIRAGAKLPSSVALIDDVATTAATLNSCAKVLKKAGVQQVHAWVIARA
jgi:ComF family protein